jgi:SEC-C motif-containing protein
MRSRYTAFVTMNEPYLLTTWHASKRPQSVPLDRATRWLGLKIVEAVATGAKTGEVEFIARCRVGGGSAARLHERSRFVREGGRWFYVDGDHDAA